MNKNEKVLELYGQRKSEGLTALALACGYAELLLEGLFGELTPEQREFAEYISQAAPKAIGLWCALDVKPEIKLNPPHDGDYNLYQMLRTEGLTPVFQMKGSAEVLLKQGKLSTEQSKLGEKIVQQCNIIQECWWYPECHLKLEENVWQSEDK